MKFLHHTILIFKGTLINATWIHNIRINGQDKFKIRIVQMLLKPDLHTYELVKLKQRENTCYHDFLYEVKIHCKNNQVNALFRRHTIGGKV